MKTDFTKIEFNKEQHTYQVGGQKLTSVTSLVNGLKNPFDRDGLSKASALKKGITQEAVLAEWDKNATDSRDKGTKVHAYIEQVLLGNTMADDPFLTLNQRLPEMNCFDYLWQQMQPATLVCFVEWVIGDVLLGVAGTMDALLWSNRTGKPHPWDWKTGKEFNLNSKFGKRLKEPFTDLDECELNLYSLQLSTYRVIVERNLNLELGDGYLVHLAGNGTYQIYKAIDLRERVKIWLEGLHGSK